MTRILIISMCSCLIISCSKPKEMPVCEVPDRTFKYLHLSHTRTAENPLMDSIVEQLNYAPYDVLMLGGDLAWLTSEDEATMDHVDGIFDFSNESTLWTLGNHDYSNLDLISEYTERPPFYAYHKNRITYLVLDSQEDNLFTQEQIDLVSNVTDTISDSDFLIVLTHKLIWMRDYAPLDELIATTSNGPSGTCSYCIKENNWYTEIYPKLANVQESNIDVLCIAGDIGNYVTEFEHETAQMITYLASGIKSGDELKKALVFNHNVTLGTLTWDYMDIETLD